MLRNLIIFSFFVISIKADGEFALLNIPKSLMFKGDEPLKSDYIDDVFNAGLGYPTTGYAQWSGLVISAPLNLPKQSVIVYIDGIRNLRVNDAEKTYAIVGSDSAEALNRFNEDLKASDSSLCYLDFTSSNGIENYKEYFDATLPETTDKSTGDKQITQAIAALNGIADNFAKKACDHLIFQMSISKASPDTLKMIPKALDKIKMATQKSGKSETLVAVIASESAHKRVRRADDSTTNPDKKNPYNLAEYYSEDYPVIFNIILWFMVVFGLSLLAISYAIGSMDPGRDSIIYRMTSTRMKKDN